MAEERTNIIYTAAEIQRYLSGKMTAAEMHGLEKAALDDPFLSEAIEGYELVTPDESEKAIGFLKDHFSTGETAKVIPLNTNKRHTSWKAIAAILLVCSGVGITYLFTNKKPIEQPGIAASVEKAIVSTSADTLLKPTDSLITNTTDNTAVAINTPTPQKKEAIIQQDGGRVTRDTAFMYQPPVVTPDKAIAQSGGGYLADKKEESPVLAYNQSNQATELAQNNVTSNAIPRNEGFNKAKSSNLNYDFAQKRAAVNNYQFKGQVVSANNIPVPFANVKIMPGNQFTYADVNGNFTVVAKDSLAAIDIRSVGYKPYQSTLHSNLTNKIVLNEDEHIQPETTVLAGKAAPNVRRRATVETDSTMDAEPEDGWDNYDAYVYNNLQLSDDASQAKIHGNVEITFDVTANGEIANIKINKSLCKDCDKEVIRILKEGPRWKVKSGNSTKAKMTVEF